MTRIRKAAKQRWCITTIRGNEEMLFINKLLSICIGKNPAPEFKALVLIFTIL